MVTSSGSMPLRSEQDIVASRQAVRKLTQELNFSLVDQTKMITAVSELSRNTVVYGGGGEMRWELLEDAARRGLRVHFEDKGPGFPDLKLALTDGWTSGKGLGMGLFPAASGWSTTSRSGRRSARAPASPSRAGNDSC